MDTNPIFMLRRKAAMSRKDFAGALGVSYQELWQAENGYRPRPQKIFEALGRLGYDRAGVEAEYQRWIAVRTAALREKIGVAP